jgi:hypothetical protein
MWRQNYLKLEGHRRQREISLLMFGANVLPAIGMCCLEMKMSRCRTQATRYSVAYLQGEMFSDFLKLKAVTGSCFWSSLLIIAVGDVII